METIRVNMTPCDDVQTIHASQNDNEAREWGFELHNNGEKIDSSSISDQLVFKAYKGGTEQILPENTSTPTTSPFLGDIRYPQGLLTDQKFTYRQSPTESDGLAFVESIKGNTLVWNQLVNNGNFASTNGWHTINTSLSVANNKATITISGNGAVIYNESIYFQKNHKILVMLKTDNTSACSIRMYSSTWAEVWFRSMNRVGNMQYSFIEPTDNTKIMYLYLNRQVGDVVTVENIQAFDLTQMGLDSITTVDEFTSLFPLSYYAYNQGTLLSFNGNGIKTVGKNRFNKDAITLNARIADGGSIYSSSASDLSDYVDIGAYDYITIAWDYLSLYAVDDRGIGLFDANKNYVGFIAYDPSLKVLTFDASIYAYIRITLDKNVFDVQIEGGQSKTPYVPYIENTLQMSLSEFPNGMKSAGNVYDEWTPNKASPRVGTVTLNGTEDWRMPDSSGNCWMNFDNMPVVADYTKTMTATVTVAKSRTSMVANSITGYNSGTTNYLYFRTADATQTNDNVKAYLQANPVTLNYELKASTETSFSTASLVTENAEIPLSNEDGILIGKCTEQLSENPGFFDAKIKLADEDGECYSNKVQLHIERSPQ